MKIKWHRFLTWFALWVSAIANVIIGVITLLAGVAMMRNRGGLAVLGFFMSAIGVGSIGLAIFTIKTTIELIKWQWWGVAHLHTIYVISLVMNAISVALSLFTLSLNFGALLSLIFSIIIVCLTTVYYDKRYQLFDTTDEERCRLLGKSKGASGALNSIRYDADLSLAGGICAAICFILMLWCDISFYRDLWNERQYYTLNFWLIFSISFYLIEYVFSLLFCTALFVKKKKIHMAGVVAFCIDALMRLVMNISNLFDGYQVPIYSWCIVASLLACSILLIALLHKPDKNKKIVAVALSGACLCVAIATGGYSFSTLVHDFDSIRRLLMTVTFYGTLILSALALRGDGTESADPDSTIQPE